MVVGRPKTFETQAYRELRTVTSPSSPQPPSPIPHPFTSLTPVEKKKKVIALQGKRKDTPLAWAWSVTCTVQVSARASILNLSYPIRINISKWEERKRVSHLLVYPPGYRI
ncbi:hypothetical protein BgiBS90_038229, partial [Biomphalaria glabrata]